MAVQHVMATQFQGKNVHFVWLTQCVTFLFLVSSTRQTWDLGWLDTKFGEIVLQRRPRWWGYDYNSLDLTILMLEFSQEV